MKVLVPIANGTEEMEAVIIIDMLRRAGIEVVVAGTENEVLCSRGVVLKPDVLIETVLTEKFDAIIIPGGLEGTENLINSEPMKEIIEYHKNNSGIFAAICAAPLILDEAGLFSDSTEFTSHPSVKEKFSHGSYQNDKVVISNSIITSAGAGTAFDFALEIIKLLTGRDMADKISKSILYR